ncbi:cupin domain protein [Clostridiales bacterium oral taxon 876 str. F0540]|nr:cupin domain protein [Clostridiales bacterium oral taxon 876 str. F0540]
MPDKLYQVIYKLVIALNCKVLRNKEEIMKIENLSSKIVYSDKTFTKRVVFNEDKVLNFILNMMPGQALPPHTHESSDLVLHILSGNGEVTVDGINQTVSEGDVLYLKGEEVFSMKNTGDKNMSAFVIITPNPSAIYSKEV